MVGVFLWNRKKSFLDMNPGKTIWVTEWRMIRTGLGDPFGPKCCIEEEDMSIKVLGECRGVNN